MLWDVLSESASTAWTIAGTLATVVIALAGGILYLRNEMAARSERRWDRALKLAAVVADENASEIVKDVARLGLEDIGVEIRERRASKRAPLIQVVLDAFNATVTRAEVTAIENALAPPAPAEEVSRRRPISDPDIRMLIDWVWRIEESFALSRARAAPEDDTRIRIFFVLLIFGSAFFVLSVGAIHSALF
jgi:hypothetical protein